MQKKLCNCMAYSYIHVTFDFHCEILFYCIEQCLIMQHCSIQLEYKKVSRCLACFSNISRTFPSTLSYLLQHRRVRCLMGDLWQGGDALQQHMIHIKNQLQLFLSDMLKENSFASSKYQYSWIFAQHHVVNDQR